MVKPYRLIDNTTLNNIFGRGGNYNAEFGINFLNMMANKYNIVVSDVIETEILQNPNYGTKPNGDPGVLETWMQSKEITPMVTGINPNIDDAGELSMNKAYDMLSGAGNDVGIISDDIKFYNDDLNPDGSYKSPEGAPYVEHTNQIQDIANEFLHDGRLPITDYQIVRNNNATMNSTNPNVTKFLTDPQIFDGTQYAIKKGYLADENGIVTDTQTGTQYNLSDVFKNMITDESGGSGTISDLAGFIGTDATTLKGFLIRGGGVAVGVAATVAIAADILRTSVTARAQVDGGDVAGAMQSVEALSARVGLGITGANAGWIAANDNEFYAEAA